LESFEKSKEKLVSELKRASSHYYENTRRQDGRQTHNH